MRKLKELRVGRGMTQKELADKVGITREYLSDLERGKYECSVKVARLIAKELGVDWTGIYDG